MDRENKSKTFIKQVENLMNTGIVKTHTEIIEQLGMTKSMFSSVMNGRRNIPIDKYNRFTEVYAVAVPDVDRVSLEALLSLEAKSTVMLSTLAEILANQRGQPVAKLLNDLEGMVKSQIRGNLEKLLALYLFSSLYL